MVAPVKLGAASKPATVAISYKAPAPAPKAAPAPAPAPKPTYNLSQIAKISPPPVAIKSSPTVISSMNNVVNALGISKNTVSQGSLATVNMGKSIIKSIDNGFSQSSAGAYNVATTINNKAGLDIKYLGQAQVEGVKSALGGAVQPILGVGQKIIQGLDSFVKPNQSQIDASLAATRASPTMTAIIPSGGILQKVTPKITPEQAKAMVVEKPKIILKPVVSQPSTTAQESGIKDISKDQIYMLPGQTLPTDISPRDRYQPVPITTQGGYQQFRILDTTNIKFMPSMYDTLSEASRAAKMSNNEDFLANPINYGGGIPAALKEFYGNSVILKNDAASSAMSALVDSKIAAMGGMTIIQDWLPGEGAGCANGVCDIINGLTGNASSSGGGILGDITGAIAAIGAAIAGALSPIGDILRGIGGDAKTIAQKALDGLTKLPEIVGNIMKDPIKAIENTLTWIQTNYGQTFDKAIAFITSVPGTIKGYLDSAYQWAVKAINTNFGDIIDKFKPIVEGIGKTVLDALSPVIAPILLAVKTIWDNWEKIKEWFMQTLANSDQYIKDTSARIAEVMQGLSDQTKAIVESIKGDIDYFTKPDLVGRTAGDMMHGLTEGITPYLQDFCSDPLAKGLPYVKVA